MSSSASATVFVIDDDPEMRAAMQRLLKTVGLHAEAFASAKDFLQRNLPEGPSCLILDIRLPGMSGLDVQRKLAEAGTRIPVIFITAHADVPLVVKAIAVSSDAMEMFGVLDLEAGFEGCRFAIGIRNANNKRFRLAMHSWTSGIRVSQSCVSRGLHLSLSKTLEAFLARGRSLDRC